MTDLATLMDWPTVAAPNARSPTANGKPYAPDNHSMPLPASGMQNDAADSFRHAEYIEQPATEDCPPLQIDERLLSSPTTPPAAIAPEPPPEDFQKPSPGHIAGARAMADVRDDVDRHPSRLHREDVASETTHVSAPRSSRSNVAGLKTRPSGSTTYSEPRLTSEQSPEGTGSGSDDNDDPVTYQNSRHFPPRLPTTSPFSGPHARSSATRKIYSWIVRRRKVQTSRRSSTSRKEGLRPRTDVSSVSDSHSISDASRTSSDRFSSVVGDIDDLWRQREESKRRIRKHKAKMYGLRSEMKALRPKIFDADNAFMNSVRPMLVIRTFLDHTSKDQVDAQFMEMQRLRNDYQGLESRCEELEDRIDQEEANLSLLEVHFFSLLGWGDDDSSSTSSSANRMLNGDIPDDLRGISSEKPTEDLHPLFRDLTFAAARLRGAREELRGLQITKHNCEETMQINEKIGQEVDPEVKRFLSQYPASMTSTTNTIAECQNKIQHLTKLCQAKDVMAKHLSVDMVAALNPGIKVEDIDLNVVEPRQHDGLMYRRFPELLSQESHLLAGPFPLTSDEALKEADVDQSGPRKSITVRRARKEAEIDGLARGRLDGETKGHYISRWLLFALRISPFHVRILFTIFTGTLKVKNERRWQIDVLRYWYKDGTGSEADPWEDELLQVGQSAPGRGHKASEGATEGSLSWGPSRAGTGTSRPMPEMSLHGLQGEG